MFGGSWQVFSFHQWSKADGYPHESAQKSQGKPGGGSRMENEEGQMQVHDTALPAVVQYSP